jgi:heterodisulfide reductase subunit C
MNVLPKAFRTPDQKQRRKIEEAVPADFHMCYTCRSCASECPVNQATGRLHPVKIVWMANLGLLDDLLQAPEIW